VGAAVDLPAMFSVDSLQLGGLLLVIGIIGKFLAGYAPFRAPIRHALVGVAMVPRGEVGLIFAQMGLTVGVLNPETFGAVMLMVIGTTLVTPPWLAWLVARRPVAVGPGQDIGTVDDLVAGER
jgi:Kef-type K+ transport system membrane component KefB